MNRFLHHAVMAAGLAVVAWAGAGYIGSNPLALAVTLLVGAFYVMGALELHRFHQATATLTKAVTELTAPPPSLGTWLAQLHPSLQNAVRLRIEGERVGLPGPAMTPYLAGFLVLLGMLGTFLGMVVTLKGTGIALESATDLQSIRASLSAPVKGLGLAFGTSVAGVAASAMLGFASALSRRERMQAGQMLDTRIATTLRMHSQVHQREESFKLLERQADAMPALVGQLQDMMAAMERQSLALNERLAAGQDGFYGRTEAAYAGLATSVDKSLQHSLTESARIASAAIQPVVEATMAGIARETASLHDTLAQTVQQQLDGLSTRFEATTGRVADTWKLALAEHQRTTEALSNEVRGAHDRLADAFGERSAALVDSVAARLESTVGSVSDTWGSALAQHQRTSEQLSADTQQALSAAAATFAQHSASLLGTVGLAHTDLQTQLASRDEQRLAAWTQSLGSMAETLRHEWQQAGAQTLAQQQHLLETMAQTARDMSAQTEAHAKSTTAEIAQLLQAAAEAPRVAGEVMAALREKLADSMDSWQATLAEHQRTTETLSAEVRGAHDRLADAFSDRSAALIDGVATRLESAVGTVSDTWGSALAQHRQASEKLSADTQHALTAAAATFEQHSASLLGSVGQAHAELQTELTSRDEQRLSAWTQSLSSVAESLQNEWQQAGASTLGQQQQLLETMAQTAREMSAQNDAHAKSTTAEIAQLLQAASEAPRVAAEVVAELRQKLSDSMARDNVMLEERGRILETLSTLLDAVNHASTEQRAAVDSLVAASADVLERVGSRFTEKVDEETNKMSTVAAQITGGAVEVASMGEAFGFAVQLFSESNDKMAAQLQRIEGALGKSIARSDEQLAYYVAQAREVIDLSIMSQKQIVEDLQQIADRQAAMGSEA
ncbi:DUF802 domain-containing protein [Variovorax sp. H27-G14]|uniref:DUF802 domain-containing protein n=1 Tax=Variovorax sp. H27-G14 TaxID=3111914 RepID=UPI0038FCCFB9